MSWGRLMVRRRNALFAFAIITSVIVLVTVSAGRNLATAQTTAGTDQFNDSHFHLTNYVQQGITPPEYLKIMGTRVGRSTLFGIPLQQMWSHANSGDFAPTYYLQSDAPLYYYSFT